MIAIDFGTSNSSVAVFSDLDTEPRLQTLEVDPDSYDANVIPSAVSSCKAPDCVHRPDTFGHEALRHFFDLPHDTSLLQEMKLYFDRATLNPPTFVETLSPITILREEDGFLTPVPRTYKHPHYEGEMPLEPRQYVPGAAKLIRELIHLSNAAPEDKREIVLGVPASFHDVGMRRIREAARRAFGDDATHENIHLYWEPVAAARSYRPIEKGNTLVLDYGGGTLDITVMAIDQAHVGKPARAVLGGFPEGGSRMDAAILKYVLSRADQRVQEWYRRQPLMTRLKVKRNVENAKISLSTREEATIDLPGSGLDPIRLNEAQLSFALQPIMARMGAKLAQTVTGAVGGIEHVNFVVLSGGTGLNKAVQANILALFQHVPPERFVLPDPAKKEDVETCLCAVAKGLAWLRRDRTRPLDVGDDE